ncbi:hypothetical protein HYH03_006585 [Edaphochlamys debaryana]|uniref:Uncharacterized protein n=1 Tax=Edaphochlamys debaryana TaxID=47281 RepID=A0A836C178_9CHLO|nr:hypothetical protein HYH03_006585 [Edaphochlamys debaryana]|eukprot:KAG2495313.1 hypothetical protein HYH03_006585 [Edaphochlamys debaryana]
MGCGTSMPVNTIASAPQAVAEAEEAALARIREENVELRRQNAQLTQQVQELNQRVNGLTADLKTLQTDIAAAHASANKAMQVAQSAQASAEAASLTAAAATQARPPTSAGPIPMPATAMDPALLQRVQQLEAQLNGMLLQQERVEGQRAKEEFAKQLRAAAGEGVPVPQHMQHSSSANSVGGGAGGGGPARASSGLDGGSASGAEVIDGQGLLPVNNNFPSRFGGPSGNALRAARDRTPVKPGQTSSAGGADEGGLPPPGPGAVHMGRGGMLVPGMGGGGGGGSAGAAFMDTHKYGNVMPSDYKLAEQRKAGPKQFL